MNLINVLVTGAMVILSGCMSPLDRMIINACDESKITTTFPPIGSTVTMSSMFLFSSPAGVETEFRNSHVCTYQGSVCYTGEWSEVWYGQDQERHRTKLHNGDVFEFCPHCKCTAFDDYKQQKVQSNFNPMEYHKFILELDENHVVNSVDGDTDWYSKLSFHRPLLSLRQFPQFDHNVEYFEIKFD